MHNVRLVGTNLQVRVRLPRLDAFRQRAPRKRTLIKVDRQVDLHLQPPTRSPCVLRPLI